MNIQKFTQKSVEAINNCEKLAYDYGNQEIEQEHLLVALLQQEEGLIPKLIEKMEIDVQHFTQNAISKLDARVKVSGSNSNVYVGKDLNNVLIHAEDEAKAMGDEYVSVEHIFLAMLKYPNPAMKALRPPRIHGIASANRTKSSLFRCYRTAPIPRECNPAGRRMR